MARCLVTGAGGFIGGHLVKRLLADGHTVVGVDIKPLDEWLQTDERIEVMPETDLKQPKKCYWACKNVDEVYMLAADMGGIFWITTQKLDCALSVLISTNMLLAASDAGVQRYFYSSSACVYPAGLQRNTDVTALREEDAYPAEPEVGYGEEKLFSERLAQLFYEDRGLETRVARYHNVYGGFGTFEGGREKAPAAICRKVIEAKQSGKHEIEIWGNGEQTRSFMFIDDCVEGTLRIMQSSVREPLNLGSSELVSINELVTMVEEIAKVKLERHYDLAAPQGVRGRNSDNAEIKKLLKWEPSISLWDGLVQTYASILEEMK